MRRRYHPYDNVRRLAERVNTGFIAPAVRTGINNAVNLVQAGLEQVPDIVWDMDAEQRADLQRWGAGVWSAVGASHLISENAPTRSSRGIRGSNEVGSSGLVHPPAPAPTRPTKRLRRSNILDRDWLHISTSPSQNSTPGSTQSYSQASQAIRRERLIGPWIRRKKKVLSWFRTRLLVRARARQRKLNSRPARSRRALIAFARYTDNLQRRYRKVNKSNTAFGRHLLQKLARAKRYLWKKRRAYRRHGFLPSIA